MKETRIFLPMVTRWCVVVCVRARVWCVLACVCVCVCVHCMCVCVCVCVHGPPRFAALCGALCVCVWGGRRPGPGRSEELEVAMV